MIASTGSTEAGTPMLLLGLSAGDVADMARGIAVVLDDIAALFPGVPSMRVVVIAGESDEANMARVQARFPAVWRLPAGDPLAVNDPPTEAGPS